MSKFPSEEQLTAYVLGELPEAERVRIDDAIRHDASLAAKVERLRKTAGYLRANLQKDAELRLTPERRAALEAALHKRSHAGSGLPAWLSSLLRPYVLGPVAAAAVVLLVVWQAGVPRATPPVAREAEKMVAQSAPSAAPAPASPEPQSQGAPSAMPPAEVPQSRSVEALAPTAPLRDLSAAGAAPSSHENARREAAAAEQAPAEAKKQTAAAPAQKTAGVRAGAYAIEVNLPPDAGSDADAERLARQVAERVTAQPAKTKKSEYAGARDEKTNQANDGFIVFEQEAGVKASRCEIVVTVVEPGGGEPGKVMRREVACSLDALVAAFKDLAKNQ